MRKLNFILVFIFSYLLLTNIALAASPLDSAKNWIADFLGIPKDLMATNKVFRFVILPFFVVFVALLGILRDIRLFRRSRLDIALAIIITFIVLPWSKAMGNLILFLYGASAFLAVIVLGGILMIGIVFWALGRWFFWKGELSAVKSINKRIEDLERDRTILQQKWADLVNRGNINQAHNVRRQIDEIDAKIREIRQAEYA